jgi:hypothetical protein
MAWEVEYTDEFEGWWGRLSEDEQVSVRASIKLLMNLGPHLPFPHACGISRPRHGHMRELRIQHQGSLRVWSEENSRVASGWG